MAERFPGEGAAANGFGRRYLHEWEGRLLYAAGYPATSDLRAPTGWRLSAGGVPISPPPEGEAMAAEIDEVLAGMTDEQRAVPQFFPDNYGAWTLYFLDKHARELASYDEPSPAPSRGPAPLVERTRAYAH